MLYNQFDLERVKLQTVWNSYFTLGWLLVVVVVIKCPALYLLRINLENTALSVQ